MPHDMRRISRRPNLAQQTYEALCDAIVDAILAPGERIILDRLAQDLGVSPTPLREAVARLIQDGLLVDSPDGKLQVAPLTRQYVHDTFWVRAALEGLAAELASPILSDADLQALESTFVATTESLKNGELETYVRADEMLHHLVATSAHNTALERELDALKTHVAYIRGYSQRQNGDHLQKSHEEHLVVFDFLKRREAEQARYAMELHIRRASDRIVQLIEFAEQRQQESSDDKVRA
jgi:DNA-binding GntR family transcriptional regulator